MRKQLTARLSIFGGPLVFALIVMANCTQLMLAQRAAGSITGIVRDNSGSVIPNAEIVATNMATNQAFHAATSSAGYYTFPILQPAVYKIAVHAAGFKEYVRNSVQLDVAAT